MDLVQHPARAVVERDDDVGGRRFDRVAEAADRLGQPERVAPLDGGDLVQRAAPRRHRLARCSRTRSSSTASLAAPDQRKVVATRTCEPGRGGRIERRVDGLCEPSDAVGMPEPGRDGCRRHAGPAAAAATAARGRRGHTRSRSPRRRKARSARRTRAAASEPGGEVGVLHRHAAGSSAVASWTVDRRPARRGGDRARTASRNACAGGLPSSLPGMDGGPARAGPDEQRAGPVPPVEQGIDQSQEADHLAVLPKQPACLQRDDPAEGVAEQPVRTMRLMGANERRRSRWPSSRPSSPPRPRPAPGAGPARRRADRRRAPGQTRELLRGSAGARDHEHGVAGPLPEHLVDHVAAPGEMGGDPLGGELVAVHEAHQRAEGHRGGDAGEIHTRDGGLEAMGERRCPAHRPEPARRSASRNVNRSMSVR